MKNFFPVGFLLTIVLAVIGCDASSRERIFGSLGTRSGSPQETTRERTDIIEALLPDEVANRRFRHVFEATMRVTGRRREDIPDKIPEFRTYLTTLSTDHLHQIQKILPEVQENPQLRWSED